MRRRGPARIVPGLWTEAALLGESGGTDSLRDRLRPAGTHGVDRGDILVFGSRLGAGTRTDEVALAFARIGVGAILAVSIDRAFRESLLHAGIPALAILDVAGAIGDGDDVTVDFQTGTVEDVTRRRMLMATPFNGTELRLARAAPSIAWYGLGPEDSDPDVVETIAAHANEY